MSDIDFLNEKNFIREFSRQLNKVFKKNKQQQVMDFLLRSKYLLRHKYPTFRSVILAGVYDVKTLKLKIRPDKEKKYNSPWNIAAAKIGRSLMLTLRLSVW
jgi:hypothetical protein